MPAKLIGDEQKQQIINCTEPGTRPANKMGICARRIACVGPCPCAAVARLVRTSRTRENAGARDCQWDRCAVGMFQAPPAEMNSWRPYALVAPAPARVASQITATTTSTENPENPHIFPSMVSAYRTDALRDPTAELRELFAAHASSQNFVAEVTRHFSSVFSSDEAFAEVRGISSGKRLEAEWKRVDSYAGRAKPSRIASRPRPSPVPRHGPRHVPIFRNVLATG